MSDKIIGVISVILSFIAGIQFHVALVQARRKK